MQVSVSFPSHALLRFRFHKVCLLVTCITLSQTLPLLALVPFATAEPCARKSVFDVFGKTQQHAQLQRPESILKICRGQLACILIAINKGADQPAQCAG